MATSTPVKALSLIVFLLLIAGATYGVREVMGDTVSSQLVFVTTPRPILNATPDQTVSYILTLGNRDTASRDIVVEVAGVATGKSEATIVRGSANTSIFVPVKVPAGLAPGAHLLDLRVLSEGVLMREQPGALTLNVMPPGDGFAPGKSAQAIYVGRLTATGRVFNTNDPALIGLSFPKTDGYRFSQGILPILSSPPNVVQGLYEGALGMQVGETRTLSFPPERGYGPATEEDTYARHDNLLRNLTLRNDPQVVPRADFDAFVKDSGDRRTNLTVGDVFTLNQNGDDWPYKILKMDNVSVEYQLTAQVGDKLTIYPFWLDGSVVTAINTTHVSFRTTPTTQPGEKITVKQFWPLMSELKSFNETHITVRNSPPQGYTFTAVSAFGQPREATVRELNEERITVALPSTNPLAGKDLTFDVTLVSLK